MFSYDLYKPWANNTLIIAGIPINNGTDIKIEYNYFYYRKIKEYNSIPWPARSDDTYKEWSLYTSMKLWNSNEWENAL